MSKPNPYGVRAVRHLKSSSSASRRKQIDRKGRMCTTKQAVMDRTYDYFLREVDPIIGACITYLLCIRPNDVATSMLDFLEKRKKGETPSLSNEKSEKATKAQRLYLATQISPIITKLVNRIASTRPTEVLDFMCSELVLIVAEGEVVNDDKKNNEIVSDSAVAEEKKTAPSVKESIKKKEVKEVKAGRTINIIFLGMGGVGKTSFIDALQGKYNEHSRPTIGFRPTNMMMGDDKIRLYDVGGGPKIRSIWPEYFHDTHAIVYLIDASETDPEKIGESVELFRQTVEDPMLQNKPTVFVSNKQDKPDAKAEDIIRELYSVDSVSNCTYVEASCIPGGPESNCVGEMDRRIEHALEELVKQAQDQYDNLNSRVEKDIVQKSELEAKKRKEKEKKVLRNKILCAFPHKVNKAFLDESSPTEPEDVFSPEEGESFLAAEIGVEKLPPIGVEVAALVGYQKLALQIVGAFIQPISKKKKAISWDECKDIVTELRLELGIVDI